MGVFDDDEIRYSPADCLLLPSLRALPHTHLRQLHVILTHTFTRTYAYTYVVSRMHKATPFLIVQELLAL